MSTRQRPLRSLAAWGYQSDSSGDRIEVDVWTVNPGERDEEDDAEERARRAFGGRVKRVIQAFGNVAHVEYHGAAGEGYRYIDMSKTNPGKEKPSDAGRMAFLGAKRAAGGSRETGGSFTGGYSSPEHLPGIEECRRHGEQDVLPVVRREFRELGQKVGREPSSDEDDEETNTTPFDGFRNAVRVFTRGGTFRYEVRNGDLVERRTRGGRHA